MKTTEKRNHGYPALAQLMGPHSGMAIFKRFSILASHDLLLRQAELLHLERKLHRQGTVDRLAGLSLSEKADELFASPVDGFGHAQLETVLEIRGRLKEYSSVALPCQTTIRTCATDPYIR